MRLSLEYRNVDFGGLVIGLGQRFVEAAYPATINENNPMRLSL